MVGFGQDPAALDVYDDEAVQAAVRTLVPGAELIATMSYDWNSDLMPAARLPSYRPGWVGKYYDVFQKDQGARVLWLFGPWRGLARLYRWCHRRRHQRQPSASARCSLRGPMLRRSLITLPLSCRAGRCTQCQAATDAAALGRKQFAKCAACHSLQEGAHLMGPSSPVWGRQVAGSRASCSRGVRVAVWDRGPCPPFLRIRRLPAGHGDALRRPAGPGQARGADRLPVQREWRRQLGAPNKASFRARVQINNNGNGEATPGSLHVRKISQQLSTGWLVP